MQYNDVMVDIETGGTNPVDTPMIQLAAVKFDLKTRTIDTENMFNRCLEIPPRRYWDEGTRTWWSTQNRALLEDIYARMEPAEEVMEAFKVWAGTSPSEPLRFWAKPTSFDYSFVQSYFNDMKVYNPFHFRWAVDLNSFIRGLARDSTVESFKTDFKGDAHNALHDCINQIDMAFKAMDHYDATPR